MLNINAQPCSCACTHILHHALHHLTFHSLSYTLLLNPDPFSSLLVSWNVSFVYPSLLSSSLSLRLPHLSLSFRNLECPHLWATHKSLQRLQPTLHLPLWPPGGAISIHPRSQSIFQRITRKMDLRPEARRRRFPFFKAKRKSLRVIRASSCRVRIQVVLLGLRLFLA